MDYYREIDVGLRKNNEELYNEYIKNYKEEENYEFDNNHIIVLKRMEYLLTIHKEKMIKEALKKVEKEFQIIYSPVFKCIQIKKEIMQLEELEQKYRKPKLNNNIT